MNEILLHNFLINFALVMLIVLAILLVFMIIFEVILSIRKTDEYIEKTNYKHLIEKFYDKLDVVSTQTTVEVLECLIEMQDLDKLYEQITEENPKFMDDLSYLRLKQSTLTKIIRNKIQTIENSKRKKEQYKALKDEIKVCQNRYPQYNEIFVETINDIKEKID